MISKVLSYELSDFSYELPDDQIAKFPVEPRDQSKLLFYENATISDHIFSNITDLIPEGSTLVVNHTKVFPARLFFKKETGAQIEVLLLEPQSHSGSFEIALSEISTTWRWKCMIRNLRRWKEGSEIHNSDLGLTAKLLDRKLQIIELQCNSKTSLSSILEKGAEIPLPPYLNRPFEEKDKTSYQSIFAKSPGAVAAPTASLHFTEAVKSKLHAKGVKFAEVLLHVGAGTFKPIDSSIEDHVMHKEYFEIKKASIEAIMASEGPVIAVGTTALRCLESLPYLAGAAEADLAIEIIQNTEEVVQLDKSDTFAKLLELNRKVFSSHTKIFIKPGFDFKIVDGLITNFHLPQSTLLLLVSAFTGGKWRSIYQYALKRSYRFLSYGDASLLMKSRK